MSKVTKKSGRPFTMLKIPVRSSSIDTNKTTNKQPTDVSRNTSTDNVEMHVDDWIEANFRRSENSYAAFVLDFMRKSAVWQMHMREFMNGHRLFCSEGEVRYRVTGASRLGHLLLNTDFTEAMAYDHTANILSCRDFSSEP